MSALLANTLADLAERIRVVSASADEAHKAAIERMLEAGHLLLEAKEACPHGQWLPFLERAGIHERKARRYMQLARSGLNPGHVSDLGGLKAALDYLAYRERIIDPTLESTAIEIQAYWQMTIAKTLDMGTIFAQAKSSFAERAAKHQWSAATRDQHWRDWLERLSFKPVEAEAYIRAAETRDPIDAEAAANIFLEKMLASPEILEQLLTQSIAEAAQP